jgi:hypothetical protein
MSRESTWDGITTADDNRGGHWSTWRWADSTITTGTPPER